MNGVQYFFNFFSFNLQDYVFKSAKRCEMTSFSMTSPHVDLNEAANCVDIMSPYRAFAHSYRIENGGIKTWKELTITGVQQLVRLLFSNNSISSGPVFQLLSYFSFNYSAGDFLSGSEVFSFHY